MLIMLFRRAEKEADWALHLHVVVHKSPYFFSERSELRPLWTQLPQCHRLSRRDSSEESTRTVTQGFEWYVDELDDFKNIHATWKAT